ncbi:HNH endonuclease, partial [Caldimonas thermodepolymerans]|uniref:HNH endonuclease n=1 Tax=Caldimonas thermodepolymerans TaxID=215580 RepID=UPI00248FF3FF
DPTARAIQVVIAKWHIAGCLRLLRGKGHSHPNNLQTLCETCNRRKQREDIAAAAQARGQS